MFAGDEVFGDEITSGPIPEGDDGVCEPHDDLSSFVRRWREISMDTRRDEELLGWR